MSEAINQLPVEFNVTKTSTALLEKTETELLTEVSGGDSPNGAFTLEQYGEKTPGDKYKKPNLLKRVRKIARSAIAATVILCPLLATEADSPLPAAIHFRHPDSQPLDSNDLVVMTANVHGWNGQHGNNFNTFMKAIKNENPDVICMQEVVADGPELRNLHQAGYNVSFDTTVHYPFKGRFGNALASRPTMEGTSAIRLPNPYTWIPRNAISMNMPTDEGTISLTNTHLSTNSSESVTQSGWLSASIKRSADILCGDFNQSPEQVLAGSFGRMVVPNLAEAEELPTFPARQPKRAIDFVISECGIRKSITLTDIDSDHLAKTVTLDISDCKSAALN